MNLSNIFLFCGGVFAFVSLCILLFRYWLLKVARNSTECIEIGEKSVVRFYFSCLVRIVFYGCVLIFDVCCYLIGVLFIMGVTYYCASLFMRYVIGIKDIELWYLIFIAPIIIFLCCLFFEWFNTLSDRIMKYPKMFVDRFFPSKPWFVPILHANTYLREVSGEEYRESYFDYENIEGLLQAIEKGIEGRQKSEKEIVQGMTNLIDSKNSSSHGLERGTATSTVSLVFDKTLTDEDWLRIQSQENPFCLKLPFDTTDDDLRKLQCLAYLQILDLSDCRNITDQALVYLKNIPQLRGVVFPENSSFTQEGFVAYENTARWESYVMPVEEYMALHPEEVPNNDITD